MALDHLRSTLNIVQFGLHHLQVEWIQDIVQGVLFLSFVDDNRNWPSTAAWTDSKESTQTSNIFHNKLVKQCVSTSKTYQLSEIYMWVTVIGCGTSIICRMIKRKPISSIEATPYAYHCIAIDMIVCVCQMHRTILKLTYEIGTIFNTLIRCVRLNDYWKT